MIERGRKTESREGGIERYRGQGRDKEIERDSGLIER